MNIRYAPTAALILGLSAIATVIVGLRRSTDAREREIAPATSGAPTIVAKDMADPIAAGDGVTRNGHNVNRSFSSPSNEQRVSAPAPDAENAQPQREDPAATGNIDEALASDPPPKATPYASLYSRESEVPSDDRMSIATDGSMNAAETDALRVPEILTDYQTFAAAAGTIDEVGTNAYELRNGAAIQMGRLWLSTDSMNVVVFPNGEVSELEFVNGITIPGGGILGSGARIVFDPEQ